MFIIRLFLELHSILHVIHLLEPAGLDALRVSEPVLRYLCGR